MRCYLDKLNDGSIMIRVRAEAADGTVGDFTEYVDPGDSFMGHDWKELERVATDTGVLEVE